MKKLILTRLMK